MPDLKELNRWSVFEVASYCEEYGVSVLIEDGRITGTEG